MRIVGVIAAIVVALILGGMLFTEVQKRETNVTLNKTKVVMFMNGDRNDHSWSESHFNGMEVAAKELNLNVTYIENAVGDSVMESDMERVISEGAKVVVCNSFGLGEVALKVAARHPEVKFFHASGIKNSNNFSTFFGRIYQMRYLSGIVAGLTTKTGNIGYVAAFDISEVNRGINAFTLGVRKVNPDAKVFVRWSKSWVDSVVTAQVTKELLDSHPIDVITVHSDALSAYDVAQERDVWIIGYNLDNGSRYPGKFLTAPVWKWDRFYVPRILEVLQNKFVSNQYWLGAESGMIGLAPLSKNVSEEARKVVEREMLRLESGEFDVFFGPIKDNSGNLRIESGESMTDMDMLNNFDWYVEGVVNEQ
ncbi:MAG: BMP family ABC transporter substrate-binding protein [Fibrobacter sp.]|nr:BMP family ABC transporter substrate-binding protein [Fibrobacter sp.]